MKRGSARNYKKFTSCNFITTHNLNRTPKSLQPDHKELSVRVSNTVCARVCVTDGLYLMLRLYSTPAFYIPEGTNENESH